MVIINKGMVMIENVKNMIWTRETELQIWFESLNLNSLDFIRFTSCFGIGFLLGLLFKRWSKYIILVGILLIIALALLQGLLIITINMTVIQKMIGFQGVTNLQYAFFEISQISKKHAVELSCSSIGFVIGFKTG